MTIKFHTEDESKDYLTFDMVEYDQFYIDIEGFLCQKASPKSYNIIADSDGEPCAAHVSELKGELKIVKILPKVTKITWG